MHRAALFRCIVLLCTHYHRFLRIVKINSISFLIILFIKLLSYNYIISCKIWVLISARWYFSFRWKNCLTSLVWACSFCASTAESPVRLNAPRNLFIIWEIIYVYSIFDIRINQSYFDDSVKLEYRELNFYLILKFISLFFIFYFNDLFGILYIYAVYCTFYMYTVCVLSICTVCILYLYGILYI